MLQALPALLLLAGSLLTLAALCGCGAREHVNPFDPLNPDTGGRVPGITVSAAHNQVDLAWSTPAIASPPRVRVSRSGVGDTAFTLLAEVPYEAAGFTDPTAVDGRDYVYRVQPVSPAGTPGVASYDTATPGPELAWAADEGLDQLLALTPDARGVLRSVQPFDTPSDLARDPFNGDLWLALPYSRAVLQVSRLGVPAQAYEVLNSPDQLAADPYSPGVWMLDQHSGAVAKITPNGDVTFDADGFAGPVAMAPDPDGGVWVAEAVGQRVTRMRPSGVRQFSIHGIDYPTAIVVEPGAPGIQAGAWIADYATGQLLRVDSQGRLMARYVGFEGALAFGRDPATGSLWVLLAPRSGDAAPAALVRLSREGRELWRRTGFVHPQGLAVNTADLSVWVADPVDNAVWKISADGTRATRLGGLAYPVAVAVDPGPTLLQAPRPGGAGARP